MFKKYLFLNLSVLVLFIADRIAKFLFVRFPAEKFGGDFISGLIDFQLAKNPGIAFGLLLNQKFLWIFIILIIFVLVWLLLKAYQQKKPAEIFGLTLIITGAISNLIDRWHYGFVIDYINVPFFTVFNLADATITFGVLILAVDILKKRKG
jgi:signal peptidase II